MKIGDDLAAEYANLLARAANKAADIRGLQKDFDELLQKIVDFPNERPSLAGRRIAVREDLNLCRAELAELKARMVVLEG